jgi:hypothetical protein
MKKNTGKPNAHTLVCQWSLLSDGLGCVSVFFFFLIRTIERLVLKKEEKGKSTKGVHTSISQDWTCSCERDKTLPKEKAGRLHITKRKTKGPIHSQLRLIMVHQKGP